MFFKGKFIRPVVHMKEFRSTSQGNEKSEMNLFIYMKIFFSSIEAS